MGIRTANGRIKNVEFKSITTPKISPWKSRNIKKEKEEVKEEKVNSNEQS